MTIRTTVDKFMMGVMALLDIPIPPAQRIIRLIAGSSVFVRTYMYVCMHLCMYVCMMYEITWYWFTPCSVNHLFDCSLDYLRGCMYLFIHPYMYVQSTNVTERTHTECSTNIRLIAGLNMFVCMHVCMYACMHVCMYACMHVCMYACMHVCMYAWCLIAGLNMFVCMYACMHVCMYACTYLYLYVCMLLHISTPPALEAAHLQIFACMHTRIYSKILVRMCACIMCSMSVCCKTYLWSMDMSTQDRFDSFVHIHALYTHRQGSENILNMGACLPVGRR
jgi:hypothetical protein